MARKKPDAPPQAADPTAPAGTLVPPEAIRAAISIVSQCIRAEAAAQWADAVGPERAPRARLSVALSSIATRIEAAAEQLA